MKHFNIIFWSIFGVSVVNEVKDNNGSVGVTIGKFIKNVNEGMK